MPALAGHCSCIVTLVTSRPAVGVDASLHAESFEWWRQHYMMHLITRPFLCSQSSSI
jgi:hypothetical protein